MLIKILSTGAVVGLILLVLKKFVPIKKLGDIVENFFDIISSTGGIKIGKKLWEAIENFLVESIDYLWYRAKLGLRRNNPKLTKKIVTMELLREKVKKENK